ncbi:GNAT family N-acetyltransferase [Schumannella soli]|uniref:Lysine N-acyltransferase MbtK n=1 Tax=Schumannella soli TaxID=2590779 RepID=A0A506Y8R7_9MICO|nr:GNAT family N-acetyltransferase [Schumannella soli]TPW77577.1 acetyltransferase [Schumannella soli]
MTSDAAPASTPSFDPALTADGDPDRLLGGTRGELVWSDPDSPLGLVELRVLDPVADLAVLHGWVAQPRSQFWGGLSEATPDELREVYEFVDALPTHHAFLAAVDGTPVALLQTYQPEHDPVGAAYPVERGDVGIHLLIGARAGARLAGYSTLLGVSFARFLFTRPAAERIVAEPDLLNEAAVTRARLSGFEIGPEIDLPDKRAQLAFLTRARLDALLTRLA